MRRTNRAFPSILITIVTIHVLYDFINAAAEVTSVTFKSDILPPYQLRDIRIIVRNMYLLSDSWHRTIIDNYKLKQYK